ncbi:putative hydrolase of the HAD superfamily [Microdochium nivale]|nr:putative hydrolase of the HAD superfamily [Microdochium nivale]
MTTNVSEAFIMSTTVCQTLPPPPLAASHEDNLGKPNRLHAPRQETVTRSYHAPRAVSTDGFVLMEPLRYTSLVVDLGNVLAFYSGNGLDLPIHTSVLRRIISSTDWAELECGRLSRDECFSRLSRDFKVEAADIQETLRLLAGTLKYNTELVNLIRYLKQAADGRLRVYLATNITAVDWELLRPTVEGWRIFDRIFTSFNLGARKLEHGYYRKLFRQAGIDPHEALFIDDKSENIVTARVLGMSCIQYYRTDGEAAMTALKNTFGDPVARGEAWLRSCAGNMWSETNTGVVIHENFAQLMILENTGDRSLVTLPENVERTWNFFNGTPALTTSVYPDDLDTTSLALRNIDGYSPDVKNSILDEVLGYMNDDGLFRVYLDRTRPRVDIHIAANVLRLFHTEGRIHQAAKTLALMCDIARTRAYELATQYYLHPDWFFYHLSELCTGQRGGNGDGDAAGLELEELHGLLRQRLPERFGSHEHNDSWSVAMRIVAAQNLGLLGEGAAAKDVETLRAAQQSDGSWSKHPWIYRYGHGVLIGNAGLVTAVAVRALKAVAAQGLSN